MIEQTREVAAEPKMRRRGKLLLVAALCALVSAVAAFLFLPRTDWEMIKVRIIDAQTGRPITNVTVTCRQTWTSLPVHRLGFSLLKAWHSKTYQCSGTFDARISVQS